MIRTKKKQFEWIEYGTERTEMARDVLYKNGTGRYKKCPQIVLPAPFTLIIVIVAPWETVPIFYAIYNWPVNQT